MKMLIRKLIKTLHNKSHEIDLNSCSKYINFLLEEDNIWRGDAADQLKKMGGIGYSYAHL